MPQHRLALCKSHYLEWFCSQTERTIQKYRMLRKGQIILVAVSGGKDSLALWDVLNRLGYKADGLYIDLGIHGGMDYSKLSRELVSHFAEENQLRLNVVHVQEEFGKSIPEFVSAGKHGQDRPCSVCGLIKRRIFNSFPRENGYDVVATGHNLDDEAAVLFANTLGWKVEQLIRQGPVLPGTGHFTAKVKPFCRFYERETAAYTLMRGIEYIEDECPFAEGSRTNYYKTLLNQLEKDQPGAKQSYYTRFIQEKEAGLQLTAGNPPK
jgi:tRNA(Ile)-lysidine synthase TilS/MesJ